MYMIAKDVNFDDTGLIGAIVQDIDSLQVLMMGYMNRESLKKTMETGTTWFYSRKRQKLWNKGETSGNYQKVQKIKYDCDGDCLLIFVKQIGVACHTGNKSCFYRSLYKEGVNELNIGQVLNDLYSIISKRKINKIEDSYTCYLFEKGQDKILKKIGEESSEVIIACKNNNADEIVYEVSDLLYHLIVMLVDKEIVLDQIKYELLSRFK